MATIQEEELRLWRPLRPDEIAELQESEWGLSATPDLFTEETVQEDPTIWLWLVAPEEIESESATFIPEPTVATEDSPLVDLEEQPVVETPVLNRESFLDIMSKDPSQLTEDEKRTIRRVKARQAMWESLGTIFWETTTEDTTTTTDPTGDFITEEEKRIAEAKAAAATTTAANVALRAEELAERVERDKVSLRESWDKQIEALKTSMSFSGFGRSSVWVERVADVEKSVNDKIAAAERIANLELDIYKAQEEWKDSKTISAMNANLSKAKSDLAQKEAESAIEIARLNKEAWLKWDEALSSFLDAALWGEAEAAKQWYDKEASLALWYISDKLGNPLKTDAEWNPIAYTWNEAWSDIKISNFKDWNDNTYVYKNWVLDNIITNTWDILSWEQLKGKKVPAEVESNKKSKQQNDFETQLRKEFNTRQEIKDFTKINSSFNKIKSWVENPSAAWDIAIVFNFMKMLDPWSTVREWEYATAANAAWVPTVVRNQWNKLKNWEFLAKEQRWDFLKTAKNIYDSEQGIAKDVADTYSSIAEAEWLRSEFILWNFWEEDIVDFELDQDIEDEIGSEWWETPTTTTTPWTFESPSWTTFNIPEEDTGLTSPDTTGWTNEIPTTWFTEKVNISRTWTNVAKDTNNPWNITADSIPAWISKEEYGKKIWATWTYLSPNGREYFVFPDVKSWTWALEADITAKISGRSWNIKPTDTLARFQRVYVWETSQNYLAVLKRMTWATSETQIKDINPNLLTQAVMKAEWFNS